MSRRALMIHHMREPRADRVSTLLSRWGFALDWRCPVGGDRLPASSAAYDVVVVYGGVQSANDTERHPAVRREIDWIERWVGRGGRYLGLCLGGQLLARALGAPVHPHPEGLHEIGYVEIHPARRRNGFLPAAQHMYQWHFEGFDLPAGAELLAVGDVFPHQAFRYGAGAYALQFHPEVTTEIMNVWIHEAGHMLDAPGAHPKWRQLADARRHGGTMASWLERFLSRLVGG